MIDDIATMADLFSRPGADTRQWVSYGLVDAESEGGRSVRFDDDEGEPLPYGVLVDVTLQPSGISVPCRVLSTAGGSGEGAFSPFGPGDEVLVAIPDGDERAGCVILGRFSNGKDVFPRTVAGMDVTRNSISFHRIATPYVLETAQSWMVRSAATGASLSIDPTGNVLISDGLGSALAINQTVISLQEASGSTLMQIDPVLRTITLQSSASESSATTLNLDDAGGLSSLMTGGQLAMVTAGGGYALGHAVTMEQVVCMTKAFMLAFAAVLAIPPPATPVTTGSLSTFFLANAPLIFQTMATQLAAAAITSLDQVSFAAVLAVPADAAGLAPGFGRPGLLF
jgi:hypothetical protein